MKEMLEKIVGTHLFARSAYSLLKGSMSVETLVLSAKEAGFKTVALTDLNVMYGALEFLNVCKKYEMKGILGLECFLDFKGQLSKYTLIAKNTLGFKELIQISSLINTQSEPLKFEHLYGKEKILAVIVHNHEGLFVEALLQQDEALLVTQASLLKAVFNELYIGLSYQEDEFWKRQNDILCRLLKPLGWIELAFPKVYYAKAEDVELNTILIGIDKGINYLEAQKWVESYRYMIDPVEMASMYSHDQLKQSDYLAQNVEAYSLNSSTYLPQFETPDNVNSKQYLTQLCLTGLSKRLESKKDHKDYRSRLKHELDVIFSMAYEDYFLIVWDFIRYAKSKGIYVGPGRGSAAGSLVAYCLGITQVDPLEFGLIFERFLNPDRISMPDIDTDFPDNRRDEVLAYVLKKYGTDHVAHIATFGTLAAKQVLRDVGKVLDISVNDLNALSKAVPSVPKMTLSLAYEQSKAFAQYIQSDSKLKNLFQLALKLEGLPRHVSTHAAGIVMSSVKLSEVVPMIQIESDMMSTQYTMEYLESLGLIKMDFLGLRNLTIIDEVVQSINQSLKVELNILKVPLNDALTIELVRKVDTVGIFQLESEGMKKLLERMNVTKFDDIVATIALFRPGPMENIPSYLEVRKYPERINYIHNDLKPILESTSGILIYQEQIMQVVQVMAGFSLAKADVMRKAMSKKNAKGLENLEKDFLEGCIEKGYSQKIAHDVFNLILKFANYGFNKSHSVAYGLISYQMAYLKANYPLYFFIALLNSVLGAEVKSFEYISEAKQHGIRILAPSINASQLNSVKENDAIRLALIMIKGLGSVAVSAILLERENGLYLSYHDFISRISMHKVNRKNIESLIDAGALDEFIDSRSSMKASLDDALKYAQMVKKPGEQGLIDFDIVKPLPLIEVKDHYLDRLENEKNALGFYLSSHPLIRIKEQLQFPLNSVQLVVSNKMQTIILMVKKIKTHRTKKGDIMAFIVAYDELADLDVIIMPHLYQKIVNDLKNQSILKIEGIVEKEGSILAKSIEVIQLEN